MGHGTAVQDIGELFPLAVAQLSWSPAAMPLKQPFIAMLVPRSDPSVNADAIHLQTLGDLTGGPPLDTEHDGPQAQNHPGRAIRLSFLPQSLEPLERARIAAGEDRLHESGACLSSPRCSRGARRCGGKSDRRKWLASRCSARPGHSWPKVRTSPDRA